MMMTTDRHMDHTVRKAIAILNFLFLLSDTILMNGQMERETDRLIMNRCMMCMSVPVSHKMLVKKCDRRKLSSAPRCSTLLKFDSGSDTGLSKSLEQQYMFQRDRLNPGAPMCFGQVCWPLIGQNSQCCHLIGQISPLTC